jgi:hypothetical protein
MLSKPLPPNLALPVSSSAFIHLLLERMVHCADLRRIREVYAVMCGQSTGILDLVPQDTIEKFASTCNSILRDNTDHMHNLLCIAIYALIAKQTPNPPGKSSIASSEGAQQSPVIENPQRCTSTFFAVNRASKTISLTSVRVLHFCSEDGEASTTEALEGLVLCTHIIEAIDSIIAAQWVRQKQNELVLKKLEGRLLSNKLETETKIAVSAFL